MGEQYAVEAMFQGFPFQVSLETLEDDPTQWRFRLEEDDADVYYSRYYSYRPEVDEKIRELDALDLFAFNLGDDRWNMSVLYDIRKIIR